MRAKFINEASIYDLQKEDIINKDSFNIWMQDSFNEELMIAAYRYEEGINEDVEDNEILDSTDFKNYVEYEINYRVDNIIDQFKSFGVEIPIWRSLLVDENWIEHFFKEGKRIGIYWSFDEAIAEPHHGYDDSKKMNIKIESSINEKYVDWINTIRLNISPTFEDEKEIRLFKNTPLKIKKIEVDGDKIDITQIQHKIFLA